MHRACGMYLAFMEHFEKHYPPEYVKTQAEVHNDTHSQSRDVRETHRETLAHRVAHQAPGFPFQSSGYLVLVQVDAVMAGHPWQHWFMFGLTLFVVFGDT